MAYRKHTDPDKYKAWVKRKKDRVRDIRIAAKSVPCADCGVQYGYWVMHFDHVRGEKDFTISCHKNRSLSPRKLEAEIAKCDVVCANCHAERTYYRILEKAGVLDV
jgi:hypothetical protein